MNRIDSSFVPSVDRIITLLKTHHSRTPDQKEYHKKSEDFWTLKLTSPFTHYWTFGYHKKCRLINLTTPNEKRIVYASGRFPVVYDYEYETMVTLPFHKNYVDFVSSDRAGKIAVTADMGPNGSIIIWSLTTFCPLHVIFEYPRVNTVRGVWISPCGLFLAVLFQDEKIRKLIIYDWATECVNTKAELHLDQRIGCVTSVKFSNENSNYIMVTTQRNVIFITFDRKNKEGKPEIKFHNGAFEDRSGVGDYTDSTYLDGTHLCYTSTVSGHVVVWSDLAFFDETVKIRPMTNKKDIVTYYRLLKCQINLIQGERSYVVVGTEFGKIIFYDQTLKIVYWVQHDELDGISGISFNLTDEEPKEQDASKSEVEAEKESDRIRANSLFILGKLCQKTKRAVEDWQVKEKVYDASLSNSLFSVRDFIVCTISGKVGYVNSSKKTIEFLLTNCISDALTFVSHPQRPYLVVASEQGIVYLVDYERNQEIVVKYQLPLGLIKRSIGGAGAHVTCLKYSCCGSYLACAMSNGYLLFLKPIMLEMKRGWARQDGTDAIKMIKFSGDTKFCAYYDSKYIYFLSMMPSLRDNPTLLGKIKSHSRTITDLIFTNNDEDGGEGRCYTIGKDGFIVEYDLQSSLDSNKVVLKKRMRIEQRFTPLCMTDHPSCSKTLIICTSDYKFRMVNTHRMVYRKSVAAPQTKKPITWLEVWKCQQSESEYALFVAGKSIGIIKMPFEINPYRWITQIIAGDGFKIGHSQLSYRCNFLFTLTKGVGVVHMWRVIPNVLEVLGRNVDPSLDCYDRLFGNERDYLLEELKDYFVYSLLLHRGDCDLKPKRIRNEMYMCEVPDVLRAMGCFLTNYEFESIMCKGEEKDKVKIEEKKITFEELAELYANNRNSSATCDKTLKRAFQRMCDFKTDTPGRKKKCINREDFVQFLEVFGEQFTNCEAFNFLRVLVKPITKETIGMVEVEKFGFLPEAITYEYFKNTILGISKKKRLQSELRATDRVVVKDRLDAEEADENREVCAKENKLLRVTLAAAALKKDVKFEEVED